jgi:hypothetical protein
LRRRRIALDAMILSIEIWFYGSTGRLYGESGERPAAGERRRSLPYATLVTSRAAPAGPGGVCATTFTWLEGTKLLREWAVTPDGRIFVSYHPRISMTK